MNEKINDQIVALMELAKLKREKPDEYKQILQAIKEVTKDLTLITLEIMNEIEEEENQRKRKDKEELNLRIAEKMKKMR